MTAKEKADFVKWAKAALHGLDESGMFCAILEDGPLTEARAAFTLQLGRCILTDKTIVMAVPYGVELPKKLEAVADKIVRFDRARPETFQQNLAVAFTELGIVPQ